MKHVLLLLALLLNAPAFAQSPAALPRLRAALQSNPQLDTGRVNRLNALGQAQYDTAPEQAKAAYAEALGLARRLGYGAGEALALLNMGFCHRLRNEYEPAMRYTQDAWRLFGQLGDTLSQVKCLYNLSYAESNQGRYGPAMDYGLQAMPLAEAAADPKWLMLICTQLARTYQVLKDYAQAHAYLERGLRVAQTAKDSSSLVRSLLLLGNLYRDQRQWVQARNYYERSMAVQSSGASGGTLDASWLLTEMATMEVLMGRDQAARAVGFQALRQLRQTNAVGFVPTVQLVLAQAHLHSGRLDSAAYYGQQVLRAGTASGVQVWIRDASNVLAQVSARQGRFADAYRYHLQFTASQDSLSSQDLARRLAAVQYNYELKKNQSRIQLLTRNEQLIRLKNQQQRWLLLGALGGLAVVGSLGLVLWRSNRQKQRVNEQLGQLDAAKNQFFANVSHELRTPLTLVLGPLDGLLTAAPALPAAVREPVALAHRSARRLAELVNRILDLTKLQAGRLELRPVPTAVAPLLRRVVTQFESLAAERRVALVAPLALPEGLRLLLDGDKVEQILTNLLINALNHTPAGGAVTVGAALPDATGHYVLTVRDTGPGIAPAEQGRVFERFYQSPQRQAQGGTGLGLALSRELATLLGGTLTLVSEPGLGAAFTLRFPAVESGAEETEEVDSGEEEAEMEPVSDHVSAFPTLSASLFTPSSRPRVLVVEDQADLRDYLRQLLTPAYEVLTATDGQDALDVLAREAPVDLVTTDAMMPRLSGTELLARLKADPARAGLPVLMLTARADDAHRLATLTVGIDDYLTKPFVPAELLARVATLLRRHDVRRQFAGLPPEAPLSTPAEPLALETETATAETSIPARPNGGAPAFTGAEGARQLGRWQAQAACHLADPDFGPAELASLLCLSERTLYRRLGELAGLTPAAWLRALRLDCARRLLEAGDFGSVADVADAAGFVNVRSFAARYAEQFGRRPHTYCN